MKSTCFVNIRCDFRNLILSIILGSESGSKENINIQPCAALTLKLTLLTLLKLSQKFVLITNWDKSQQIMLVENFYLVSFYARVINDANRQLEKLSLSNSDY